MFKGIKRFFGSDDEQSDIKTGPLGLVVGGSWTVELFAVRANSEAYQFEAGDGTSTIKAYGNADLGDGVVLHRYYDENDQMLQVLAEKDDQTAIQEITLFQPFDSIHPNSKQAWEEWTGPQGWMRQKTYELDDGTTYNRVWFADDPGAVEPVQFRESLYRQREGMPSEQISQSCMLYSRDIDNSPPEHLLVIKESNDAGSSMELMVGLDITESQLSIF